MKGISEGVFSRYFLYSGKSPHFLRPAASNNGIPKNKFIIIHWFYMFKAAFRIHLTLTIHLSVIVDSDPRIHIWKKWIRVQSGSDSFDLFWCYQDPNQCFLKWIRIREKKSKWIRIWIRSGDWSGSESGQMQWIRVDPKRCKREKEYITFGKWLS